MTTRQEVEIDYCPECRGIWLDRGELDKIIARTRAAEQEVERPQAPPARSQRFHDSSSDMHVRGRHNQSEGYYDPYTDKRKRKSTSSRLSDLFDLF